MTTKQKQRKQQKTRVWDAACKLVLSRTSPCGIYCGQIDPGVNYFVLMLEQLGARTHYSCEGHPNSFYVMFEAPMRLAEKIRACGYFVVELEGHNKWSIRINGQIEERIRKDVLRNAADSWEARLGPLDILNL